MLPAFTVGPLLAAAVSGTLNGNVPEYSLSIWHGFNLPLAMSFAALIGGILIYSLRKWAFRWYEGLPTVDSLEVFERVMGGLTLAARHVTRSEERRVGKECVSTGRSRWSPEH